MHNFAHCKKEEKIKREKKKKKTNMHICTLHIAQVEREVLRPHQRLLPLLQVICAISLAHCSALVGIEPFNETGPK